MPPISSLTKFHHPTMAGGNFGYDCHHCDVDDDDDGDDSLLLTLSIGQYWRVLVPGK